MLQSPLKFGLQLISKNVPCIILFINKQYSFLHTFIFYIESKLLTFFDHIPTKNVFWVK